MSVTFNPKALDAFRNVQLGDDKGIAQFDPQNGNIKQVNTYKGAFLGMFRGSTNAKRNNEIRTELLRSLGQAFGIEGMSEQNGKVTFSKKFMDKLEKILGKEFKRSDFGVGDDGTVSSGRPLTQRRITAILKQATLAGKVEFDLDLYSKKLGEIQTRLNAMPPGKADMGKVKKTFNQVGKVIDFLKNEIDGFIVKDEGYAFLVGIKDFDTIKREGLTEYTMHNAITGEDVKLEGNKIGPAMTYLSDRLGELFHLELNAKTPDLVTPYVKHEMETFVKYAIDNFNDALQTDQLDEFLKFMEDPGVCMEDQTKNLIAFQEKHGLKEEAPVDEVSDIPLERIANHDKNTKLSDCIFKELDEVDARNEKNGVGEFNSWEQYEKPVKEKLVGLERPMVTATKNQKGEWEFNPVLNEKGEPVVKKLTAEDLDKIGPACVEFVTVY